MSEPRRPDQAAAIVDPLLRERAEVLAGMLSVRPLRSEEAADTIFDLLAEIERLRKALEEIMQIGGLNAGEEIAAVVREALNG